MTNHVRRIRCLTLIKTKNIIFKIGLEFLSIVKFRIHIITVSITVRLKLDNTNMIKILVLKKN